MDLAQRVATRYMQRLADATAPSIENALAELAALRQLDINLDEVETTFGMHYKIAAEIDPEVKTQFQTLQKAREGLKSAQQVAKSVEEILKFFPEDKTALRAKSDAEVMIKRFQKHEADAGKIIETLSKKVLPETLKKMAKAAAKLIEERLINPDHLRITPWQSNVFKAVVFQMVFTIDRKADPPPPQSAKLILEEDTGKTVGPMIYGQFGQSKPATARDFADAFLKNLQGWRGLKGEGEAIDGRKAIAEQIKRALDSAMGRLRYSDLEGATISHDNREIEASYRSDLPKEGAYSVGESQYDEMVRVEITSAKKTVDAALAPWKEKIERVGYSAGEKSWIYISVHLK